MFAGVVTLFACAYASDRMEDVAWHLGQGLTLLHFSAQPERFLTLKTSPRRLSTPSTPVISTP
jgi:hypothetical protein